jgi:uncharacterized RDD family membrane protein YckC
MTDAFTADEYASWGRRFTAWILDSIIFVIAFSIALVAFAAVNGGEVHAEGAGFFLPMAAFSFLWDVGWIAGPSGAKPGHRLLGLRIRALDGSRVGVKLAAVRWLVRSTNYVFVGLEALGSAVTIAATPRHQALHDLVASCVAVRREAVERIGGPLGQVPGSIQAQTTSVASTSTPHGPFQADDEPSRPQGPFL